MELTAILFQYVLFQLGYHLELGYNLNLPRYSTLVDYLFG